jgi:hypothetical protein
MNRIAKTIEKWSGAEKRKRNNLFIFVLKYLSLAFIIILIMSVILFFAHLSIISDVYTRTKQGKNALETAVYYLQKKDFKKSKESSEIASANFNQAVIGLEDLRESVFIKYSFVYLSEIDNVIRLLLTFKYLSNAASEGSSMGNEITVSLHKNDLNFSEFNVMEKRKILDYFYKSTDKIIILKKTISAANQQAGQIRSNTFLWPIRNQIAELKSVLKNGDDILTGAIPMTKLLPPLFGYPQRAEYLVLLQNSDELRPTGGFIGTFGLLAVDSGDIVKFETHDIYHLDMPIKDRINVTPPWPLEKYLGVPKWYMRDANWSPDWPVAAGQINWFYLNENKLLPDPYPVKDFNFVMGLTPKFITGLLKLTGPITVEGVEYDENNFVDLLQYRVEKGYEKVGESSWQRKEVIGEISKQIKIKLLNMPINKWPDIMEVLSKSAGSKDIVLSSGSQVLEQIIKNIGIGGEVKQLKGDFLMVVDANMAALKTDAVMTRNIEYSIEQKNDGLFANVNVNYTHNGDIDWKTSKYRSYTRVFVPQGSILIKSSGQSQGDVYVNKELNKTYFGAFVEVPPHQTASLRFYYKLPPRIVDLHKYQLYIQKQAGNDIDRLTVNLKFNNNISNFYPADLFSNRSAKSISWQTDLLSDKIFEINLK